MTEKQLEDQAGDDLRNFGICFYRITTDGLKCVPAWQVILEDEGIISTSLTPPQE